MIDTSNYTPQEMDTLYCVVEEAVSERKALDMSRIERMIKTGDFYLWGSGANGLLFSFNGLLWVEKGEIYRCLIQPQVRRDILPVWYPVISVNDRDHSSSGILSMIKKENRYCKIIKPGWER